MLRRVDRAPVKLNLARHAPITADRVLAENHAMLRWLDGERPKIKELVVQRAQRKPVRLDVRPANVMPLNVRCLQPGWR